MRRFTRLYLELDQTTRTSEKLGALRSYFRDAPAKDAAWALMILTGRRLLRTISFPVLRDAACEVSGFQPWMLEECYGAVGDLSETIALLLPGAPADTDTPLSEVFERVILPMGRSDPPAASALLKQAWGSLPSDQLFIFHKLISGTFRVGVQKRLVVRALAEVAGIDAAVMAHRLTGDFEPTVESYTAILSPRAQPDDVSRPYPFCLAHQLDLAPETLGDPADWRSEWKWDGIRAQLIRRAGRTFLWSRGEEPIAAQFPEIAAVGEALEEGTVLDGEVLAWRTAPTGEGPLRFKSLQTRLGRKDLQPSLFDRTTVMFMAFDLLEFKGQDIRERPLDERRELLERIARPLMATRHIRLSDRFTAASWAEFARARARASTVPAAEGLMLKHRHSVYHVGRARGDAAKGAAGWWKWKLDPYSVDAVLLYAQPGSGRRAGLFTDYTFAVWDGPTLVPFAKAYSGLTDHELHEVDAFIRSHTLDRRGPVRFVEPTLVFEIAFQEIHPSTRHRSGVAVRFPRIARWRRDKRADQADHIEKLDELLSLDEAALPKRPRPARPKPPA
jgi:ATP-dependent DNA ligase